jgi:hypothetical protein
MWQDDFLPRPILRPRSRGVIQNFRSRLPSLCLSASLQTQLQIRTLRLSHGLSPNIFHPNLSLLPSIGLSPAAMPDYFTLRSSSQAPSAHTQRSIRHRSGAYPSSPSSPKTLAASQQTLDHHLPDAQVGHSDGHVAATTSSPSNVSHFTAIPARSRRSSIVSSRFGPHLSLSYPATLDVGDETIALPAAKPPTTPPAALSISHFSQISTNIQLLASYLAHSTLTSLRQKRKLFSLPNSRLLSLPITLNPSDRPLSPKASSGLGRALTPTDKLTHKWPRPRSSRSVAPWLNPASTRSSRDPRGAGGWSQGHIEAALRDSRGLGVNWVGQWTLHKWCLLASVTTVFLLGLTCLVFSLLTWFAGESTTQSACPVAHTSIGQLTPRHLFSSLRILLLSSCSHLALLYSCSLRWLVSLGRS